MEQGGICSVTAPQIIRTPGTRGKTSRFTPPSKLTFAAKILSRHLYSNIITDFLNDIKI